MNETWDEEVTLLRFTYESDEYGVRKKIPIPETVMAKKRSISRNEFYLSGQSGIQVAHLFVVHSFEYEGQVELNFEGEVYKIIKTYPVNFDEIELTCEKKVGHQDGDSTR